jgi:hypothetical protein
VRWWERRDPHVEWPRSVIFTAATRVSADAPMETGIDGHVIGLRVISHGGGVRGVTQACNGPHLRWHNVGDDGAARSGFFHFLSQFVVV